MYNYTHYANCHTNININLGKNWAVLEFLEMGHCVDVPETVNMNK